MEDISIIIPSRLASVRLPNKPLKKIKDLEMVLHVNELAEKILVKLLLLLQTKNCRASQGLWW